MERKIPVIPLLVEGSGLPRKQDLPKDIQELADRSGTEIRSDEHFHDDISQLIARLAPMMGISISQSGWAISNPQTDMGGFKPTSALIDPSQKILPDSVRGQRQNPNLPDLGPTSQIPYLPSVPDFRPAFIFIREGKAAGNKLELVKDFITIGRSRESDIFLEDLAVSRRHASIRRDNLGLFVLRDENSVNGTEVNGQRIHEHSLLEGDEIKLGQTILVFLRRA